MNYDRVIYKPPEVTRSRTEDKEIWWDVYVTTPMRAEHNIYGTLGLKEQKVHHHRDISTTGYKPGVCLQEQTREICFSGMSTTTAVPEVYIFYHSHHCWALEAVPKKLEENLQCLGMQRDKIQTIINRLQRAALLGSVKICKMVLKCN